jgi:iron complex outermembrane receptor protein
MRWTEFPMTPVALACVFSLTALSCHAQAQPSSTTSGTTQSDSTLPEVVIRASRPDTPDELPGTYAGGQVARGARIGVLGNQSVMTTPFSVTSFTSELIENQQAATLQDVLTNDASVRTDVRGRGTQNGGGDVFNIRGFSVTNRDTALNGVFGVLPYGSISMETVERVELLKGPNAMLNGMAPSGGVGGAINIVPKRAGEIPLTRLTATYASDKQLGVHIDTGRRFGEENELGVRFNGVYRNGDTAVNGQSAELGVAAFGIDYRSEKGRISADLGHQNDRYKAQSTVFELDPSVLTRIPSAPEASDRLGQPWAYNHSKDTYGVVSGEYDVLPATTLYGSIGQRKHKHGLLRSQSYLLGDDGAIEGVPTFYPEASDSNTFQAGIRTALETGSIKHAVNFSLSSLQTKSKFAYQWWPSYSSDLYQLTVTPAPIMSDVDPAGFRDLRLASKSRFDSFALSDTLSFYQDRVQLTVGVRHQKVTADTYDTFGGTGEVIASYEKNAVTPAVGVLFQPWQDLSVYANYIEALSQGTIVPDFPEYENANQVFAPTKTKQKEIGIKRDFGSSTVALSLFEISQPNAIVVPGTTAFVYKMDGEQRNRGVEFSAFGEPIRGVRLLGGITYLEAKQNKTQDGTNDGKNAIGIPSKMANVGVEWDTPFVSGLTLTARLTATGRQYADAGNTLSLRGWSRWDAGVRYKATAFGKPMTIRANVFNLGDRSYWESVSPTTGLRISEPMKFALSASMDF